MKATAIAVLLILLLSVTSCQGPGSGTEPGENPTGGNYEEPQSQGDTYWWHDTVFYEVFVRSFYDSSGDGTGDLNGLIEKLDYLNDGNPGTATDLGVTGLWLMPVCQAASYHGYDVTDYREVAAEYGTNADFIRLVNAARARGIRVIVDLVLNHTSDLHPWFTASASQAVQGAAGDGTDYANWYRWTFSKPLTKGPWGQEVWHGHANGRYYYGLFWSGMPDLNYNEPAVYDEIISIAGYWLQVMQVDGFRLDAVKYIHEEGENLQDVSATYDFWRRFRQDTGLISPGVFRVGEAWDDTAVVKEYVTRGELDLCFEFNLATTIINATGSAGPSIVKAKMKELKDAYPYHRYGTFLTNHDQDRLMNEVGEDRSRARLAASVYLTLPGVPFIYYGEEIGMRGEKPDENIRRPMQWDGTANAGFSAGTPWHPVDSNYSTVNAAAQQSDTASLWHRYRRLIELRTAYDALDRGTYQAVESSTGWVYAYLRQYGDQVICIMHNFSSTAVSNISLTIDQTNIPAGTYTVAELLHGILATGTGIDTGGGFTGWTPLPQLDAGETYVLLFQRGA